MKQIFVAVEIKIFLRKIPRLFTMYLEYFNSEEQRFNIFMVLTKMSVPLNSKYGYSMNINCLKSVCTWIKTMIRGRIF